MRTVDGATVPEQELHHQPRHSAAPTAGPGLPLGRGPPSAAGGPRQRDAAQSTLLLRSHGHAADFCADQDHAPTGRMAT